MAARGLALFSSALAGWSPEKVVEAALETGLQAVEWGLGPGEALVAEEAAVERVRALCAESGLAVCGASAQDPAVTLAQPERVSSAVEFARALGAPHLRVFAPGPEVGGLRRAAERCAEVAAAAGLMILVEVSPGTAVPSPELARRLVDGLPHDVIGVLYDPGNMVIEGHLAPGLAVDVLGPYLQHVHVKNIAWMREGSRWHWRHAALAEGLLDWRDVFEALATGGYRGWLALDHLARTPSLEALRSELTVARELASGLL